MTEALHWIFTLPASVVQLVGLFHLTRVNIVNKYTPTHSHSHAVWFYVYTAIYIYSINSNLWIISIGFNYNFYKPTDCMCNTSLVYIFMYINIYIGWGGLVLPNRKRYHHFTVTFRARLSPILSQKTSASLPITPSTK